MEQGASDSRIDPTQIVARSVSANFENGLLEVTVRGGVDHHEPEQIQTKHVSELALEGDSTYPIEPFEITRPAITDRTFEKTFHA